jgi:hypothetical protein
MPQLVQHIAKNPSSLLVRFYGLYRVQMPQLHKCLYFIVMSSVFDTDKPIHTKYDLKGKCSIVLLC